MFSGTVSTNVTNLQKRNGINVLLKAMLGSDALVERWWLSDNIYFGDKPENCDLDEVYRYVLGFYDK
jgi:hypothetical protein